MPRKPAKASPVDPVKVCTLALKQVKCAADYYTLGSINSTEILTVAWEQLATDEQQRITDLINSNVQLGPQALANELVGGRLPGLVYLHKTKRTICSGR